MLDKHLNNYKKRQKKYIIFYDYISQGTRMRSMRELFSRKLDLFSAVTDLKKVHETESVVITGVQEL